MTGPVEYMERTRAYYLAQGYERGYAWATHEQIPFTPLRKPLARSRITLITTAMPIKPEPLPKLVESGATAQPPERLFADDLAWDKEATHLDDLDSYFPLTQLKAQVGAGRLGSLAEHYHCVPTEYSQRRTIELDAPEILARCIRDEVDVALLVPL